MFWHINCSSIYGLTYFAFSSYWRPGSTKVIATPIFLKFPTCGKYEPGLRYAPEMSFETCVPLENKSSKLIFISKNIFQFSYTRNFLQNLKNSGKRKCFRKSFKNESLQIVAESTRTLVPLTLTLDCERMAA